MSVRSSLAARVLLALAAGIVLGGLLRAAEDPRVLEIPRAIEPVGQLWIRALQMTVIPLVVSLLVTGVGSAAAAGAVGRLGVLTGLLFLVLLALAAALGVVATVPLLAWLPIDAAGAAALRASAAAEATPTPAAPGIGEWLIGIVPANPVRAAADGAMLPLIVFALLFGLALTRLPPERRQPVERFFRAVADAMLALVGWVLALAPVGVFALVLPLAARIGLSAAGVLAYYVAIVAAVLTALTVLMYPLATVAGRVPPGRFARASLPAQTIAVSTRSSLASLPAMIEGARRLGLPEHVASFVLPLAVSLFRISTPPGSVVTALFAARLYGIELSALQIATIAASTAVLSLGVVGVPGAATYFVTRIPVFTAVGLPLEVLGPMLAVDVIPDIFRTVNNVTADLAVTAVVAKDQRSEVGGRGI